MVLDLLNEAPNLCKMLVRMKAGSTGQLLYVSSFLLSYYWHHELIGSYDISRCANMKEECGKYTSELEEWIYINPKWFEAKPTLSMF